MHTLTNYILWLLASIVGVVFGMFLGMMGDMQPLQMVNGREVPQAPLREQVIGQTLIMTTDNIAVNELAVCLRASSQL